MLEDRPNCRHLKHIRKPARKQGGNFTQEEGGLVQRFADNVELDEATKREVPRSLSTSDSVKVSMFYQFAENTGTSSSSVLMHSLLRRPHKLTAASLRKQSLPLPPFATQLQVRPVRKKLLRAQSKFSSGRPCALFCIWCEKHDLACLDIVSNVQNYPNTLRAVGSTNNSDDALDTNNVSREPLDDKTSFFEGRTVITGHPSI